jgi:hypothetical protein
MEELKFCRACAELKELKDYYKDSKYTDKLMPKCKVCTDNRVPLIKEVKAETNFKVCSHCKKVLNKSNFSKSLSAPDGLQYKCKTCEKSLSKAIQKAEKVIVGSTKICSKCKEPRDISLYSKNSYSKDGLRPDCQICKKAKRNFNKELELQKVREYYQKNKIRINEQRRIKNVKRRKEDHVYRTKVVYRSLVKSSFKQYLRGKKVKRSKSLDILGCSFDYYISHIETQFLDWMNWSNNGRCKDSSLKCTWHLDHIIPCSYAKNEEELHLLNHWSNFQPLCGVLNKFKSSTVYPCTNLELGITFWENHYEYINTK